MIEAQRQFEAYTKVMQPTDTIDKETVSKVGRKARLMINTTQILEPAMHIVAASSSLSAGGKRKSAIASLLERLGICRSPRILNAVCLAGDGGGAEARP